MNKSEEKIIFEKLKNGDKKAFEIFFYTYYGYLCFFANGIIHDHIAAEEIVQDFFVKLWEKRDRIFIETSVKNYFFRSVKNLCLNHIKHNNTKAKYAQNFLEEIENNYSEDVIFQEVDLARKIEESINSLPGKRQEIFRLSREEGLKYIEIAERLNISIKTVEAQISLAIKTLREKLKDYYSFLTFF